MTFSNVSTSDRKFKQHVNFDSDEESDTEPPLEISDVTLDSRETVRHIKNKCCRRFLRFIRRAKRFKFRKLPYRVRFKLAVMSLKCLQVVFALLWTLTTYLQPHLNHWVGGRFKWIAYIFLYVCTNPSNWKFLNDFIEFTKQLSILWTCLKKLCSGFYFSLYIMVRFLGFLHGYRKLVAIFIIFTLSMAHVTAVMSLTTGDLIMPVILGLILFLGLNYIIINSQILEGDVCCRHFYRISVTLFIGAYLIVTLAGIFMGSLHVTERNELNKQMASIHCALVIGAFYGVYIIYEIRMFLDNQRLALDGASDDYILAAVVI